MSQNPNIRVSGSRGGYTVIPNSLLEPGVITARAYGILCYLRSRPGDWVCTVHDLRNWFREGRDAIYAALRELVTTGYMWQERYTEPGNTLERRRYALDADDTHRRRSAPDPENPDAGQPDAEKAGVITTDLPTTDLPTTTSAAPPISRRARDSRRPAPARPTSRSDASRPAKTRRKTTDADADRNPAVALGLFEVPEPDAPAAKGPGPDTGLGLAHHFQQRFRADDRLAAQLGTVNLSALAAQLNAWKKDGVTPGQIRQMINIYVADTSLHQRGKAPWISFLNRRHALAERLAEQAERDRWTNPASDGYHEQWGTTAEDIAEFEQTMTWGEIQAKAGSRA